MRTNDGRPPAQEVEEARRLLANGPRSYGRPPANSYASRLASDE